METQGIDGVHEAWTHPSSGSLGKKQPCQPLGFQLSPPEPRERKKVKLLSLVRLHGLSPTRLLCPWDFPGKITGGDGHFLLQGIFPTQGSDPGLPHCRQTLYHLSHQGSPRTMRQLSYDKSSQIVCDTLLQQS